LPRPPAWGAGPSRKTQSIGRRKQAPHRGLGGGGGTTLCPQEKRSRRGTRVERKPSGNREAGEVAYIHEDTGDRPRHPAEKEKKKRELKQTESKVRPFRGKRERKGLQNSNKHLRGGGERLRKGRERAHPQKETFEKTRKTLEAPGESHPKVQR